MFEENIPELAAFIGKAGDLVPAVDPADLKALWQHDQELRAQYPNGGVATGIEFLKRIISPGADTGAVTYRCQMLGLLAMVLEPAWPGGQLSEAAFEAAAQIELKWMGVGVPQKGLPFDAEEFLAQVHGMSLYKQGAAGRDNCAKDNADANRVNRTASFFIR
jgi:hypothetical protein